LLTLNIIVCSIDRLKSTWKIIFTREPHFSISRFNNLPGKKEFLDIRTPDQLLENYMPFITKGFGYKRVEKTDEGNLCIFAEKGRWTRLGVYIVHSSIVFLLLGSLLVSFFGFQGYANIPEGESVNSVQINNSNQTKTLDFSVRCDDFKISYYESGEPKEYRSSLSILEAGRVAFKKEIIVNDPLRYKGINFFQSSYGKISEGHDDRYYTGLQVTKSPGVGVVYTGFILMIIGCFITFFMSHQMLCVEIVKRGNKSRIMIAGIADKDKYGMQVRIDKIYRKISGQVEVNDEAKLNNSIK
jgi:cytochrome c biogenesis protein